MRHYSVSGYFPRAMNPAIICATCSAAFTMRWMSASQSNLAMPAQNPSDAALVVAARAGEGWAKEALYRRYIDLALGRVYRLLGSDHEVDDLVQDAFIAAFNNLARLRDPEKFRGWLMSIMTRTAYKKIRRWKLMRKVGLRGGHALDVESRTSVNAPPEVVMEIQAVYEAIGGLSPNERTALILKRIEGLSTEETAAQLGVSKATAERYLKRATESLAKKVRPKEL